VVAPPVHSSPAYNFKVDNNDFSLDDNKLDSAFNDGFNQLVQSGYAKVNDRNEWNQRYQVWKQQAKDGQYNIDMQGNELGGLTHTGGAAPIGNADLGEDKKGNAAKSNFLGRVFGGVDDGDKQMALLNSVLGKNIGVMAQNKFQSDQDTANKAATAAATQKTQDMNDFVGKYNSYANPATALYGRDGEGDAGATWAGKQFWGAKTGQTNQLISKLGEFGTYLNDPRFNDPEYQKQFKAATKMDINDARSAFTKYGYNNGAFGKDANINTVTGVLGGLGLHRAYEPFLDKNVYNASLTPVTPGAPGTPGVAGTGTPGATPTASALKKDGNLFVDSNGIHYNDALGKIPTSGSFNGVLYDKGKLANGIFGGDVNNPDTYEDSKYYLNGRVSNKAAYEGDLQKKNDPQAIQGYQDQLKQMIGNKQQFLGNFSTIEDGSNERGDHIFNKEYQNGTTPSKAADVTNLFPEAGQRERRVVQYIPHNAPNDPITGQPIVRTRLAFRNGSTADGILGTDPITGRAYLKDQAGTKLDLGYQLNPQNPNDRNRIGSQQQNLYLKDYNGVKPVGDEQGSYKAGQYDSGFTAGIGYKDGGKITIDPSKLNFIKRIKKNQAGGSVIAMGKQNVGNANSANMSEVFNSGVNLSSADKWQLGGLAADTAGLIASFTGVGSLGAAGLGAAGTTANMIANFKRDGSSNVLGDLGSAALGYGLDAITAIPGLGIASDTGKVVKGLRSASKLLGTAFAGIGAYEGVKSLAKLNDPGSMTVSDWENIAGGLQAVVSGKRMFDNVISTEKAPTSTVRINGEDKEISPTLMTKLSTIKSPQQQIETIKEAFTPPGGNPDDVNVDTKTSKNFMKFKFWQPDNVSKPIINTANEYKLKDIDGAQNWYVRNAIGNTASMNPTLNGADKVLNRFSINPDGDIVSDGTAKRLGFFGNNTRPSLGGTKNKGNLVDVLNQRLSTAFANGDSGPDWTNTGTPDQSTNLPNGQANQYFLKFKKGGILKAQQGNIVPFISSDDGDLSGGNGFGTNYYGTNSPAPTSKVLNTSIPPIQQNVATTYINPKSTNLWGALGLGGIKAPKVDPVFASELGRALYIRNNNANVDINVRPALMTQTSETPISVHGDLFTRNLYNQRANNLIQSSSRQNTSSDGMLNVAKMMGVNDQAQQIMDQGQSEDNQVLNQNRARNEQAQQQYAQNRASIANQNSSNLASADESMRQLKNMKQAAMNQPIDDLWKSQDMKADYLNQQSKQANLQLQGMGEQATYNNYALPLTNQMNDIYNKMYSATNETDRANYNKQYTDLQNQASRLQSKFNYRLTALQGRIAMPDYNPSTYYLDSFKPNYISTANIAPQQFKTGGEVAMEERGKNQRAYMKEEDERTKSFAANYDKWIADSQDNESRESISALKGINDIIKKALS
jgi:hypothetical protein